MAAASPYRIPGERPPVEPPAPLAPVRAPPAKEVEAEFEGITCPAVGYELPFIPDRGLEWLDDQSAAPSAPRDHRNVAIWLLVGTGLALGVVALVYALGL